MIQILEKVGFAGRGSGNPRKEAALAASLFLRGPGLLI